jgi:hypothetical protein
LINSAGFIYCALPLLFDYQRGFRFAVPFRDFAVASLACRHYPFLPFSIYFSGFHTTKAVMPHSLQIL